MNMQEQLVVNAASDVEKKFELQEAEYRLPVHWLLRKHGLIGYMRKTELMAGMVRASGLRGGKLLDVGCGDGRALFELSRLIGPSFECLGIDFSPRAIAFARLMAPRIAFEVQDGASLGVESSSMSLVVAREVIEHVPPADVPAFLGEIYRVLEPGGKVLITTPSERRKVLEKHFQHFSPAKLHAVVAAAGFRPEQIKGFGWWPPARFESRYRDVLALPALWRIHVALGTHERAPEKADCVMLLAGK